MTNDEKPKSSRKINRRLLGLLFSLASLAGLIYIAITLITGGDLGLRSLTNLFATRTPDAVAEELDFNVGRERVFAHLDGAVASVGTLGIQVLDLAGNETLSDPFRMTRPAIKSAAGSAIAFDIGGTQVRVFDNSQIAASIEASGAIVSASINTNGWFCVSTQGSAGLRGVATVYNDQGRAVYRVNLVTGYVLSAVLSHDNSDLAVLSLTDVGSRLAFYKGMSEENPDFEFNFTGELILDMHYLPSGELLAISTDTLFMVNRNGEYRELYRFSGGQLRGYILDGSFTVLYLLDYGVGYLGRLVTLDDDGTPLGEYTTDRVLISMSYSDGTLAVLKSDGLSFYDAELQETLAAGEQMSLAGVNNIIALGDGVALAAGDHSAILFRKLPDS